MQQTNNLLHEKHDEILLDFLNSRLVEFNLHVHVQNIQID